uniref:cysteine desulfurase family protein n=1 Tax=Ezakiella massiliensis TaxID=1852374 RepID=UPI00094E8613|nr:cysteine desulfurase family protein [Ezakiella massiliensis]
MIYFDYAATSLFREEIFEYIFKHLGDFDGNTESTHAYGRSSRKILEEARADIARSLNADPTYIYFNSGASEGNNTILKSFYNSEILTTNIEHSSIINNISEKTQIVKVDQSGIFKVEDIIEKISDNTKLISVQYVNNELGTIQPVEELGAWLAENHPDIWLHVDAVQAYGHIDIDVEKIKCTSLSISAHKLGASKNFGILFANRDFAPLIKAGDQEQGLRGGTGNTIGAYSCARAYEYMVKDRAYIKSLKEYFLKKISKSNINYQVNGDLNSQTDHILNIYFKDFETDFLLTYLDMHGICVSSGSACKSGSHLPSHVITNTYSEDRAEHSIRFSFGYKNTFEDIDKLIKVLGDIK